MSTQITNNQAETYRWDEAETNEGLLHFDLERLLDIVNRNKWWILLIVGGAIIAGIVLSMLTTPRYVATSQVLIEQQGDQIIEGGDVEQVSDPYDAQRFLQTQIDIIQSRTLAARVVENERYWQDDRLFAAFGAEAPVDETEAKALATDLLQGSLTTELPFESRVIPISINTIDPVYSARLANDFAENYIESNLTRKFDSSAYAREFLAGELQEARDRLETSERDLNQYSRAAGLIRVAGNSSEGAGGEGTLSVTNDSLVRANSDASAATAERVARQDRWETVAGEPVLSIPEVLSNPAIQDLIQQKARVSAELAEERARHLDGHPTVKSLQARANELDNRMETVGRSIKRSIYLEYEAARQKEGALGSRVGALQSAALNEQDRGVQYNVLKRVADTNRALYDSLLERFNELNASAGAASNNISLVDRAEVPYGPSSPNIPFNLLIATVLGLLAAGGFVFVREYFDDVIRSPEDVESKLGLPMLGLIPLVEDDVRAELRDSKSPMSESYHSLVTNLLYSTSTGLPRSMLITSASEGQGKSTTAMALALDLARLGRSVLLVDADLRRPTLHRQIENRAELGLTALLAGQADLDSVLLPGPVDNLSFVTALPIPPEPSLLLGGGRLPEVLDKMRARYDVVVVDGPPMLGLSDAAMLASHVDGVLVMADASGFHRGAVKSTVRRLKMVNAKVLGVVVTKFDPKGAGGEYSYYGYNYYQYDTDRPA